MQLTPYLYYNELVHTNITGKLGHAIFSLEEVYCAHKVISLSPNTPPPHTHTPSI